MRSFLRGERQLLFLLSTLFTLGLQRYGLVDWLLVQRERQQVVVPQGALVEVIRPSSRALRLLHFIQLLFKHGPEVLDLTFDPADVHVLDIGPGELDHLLVGASPLYFIRIVPRLNPPETIVLFIQFEETGDKLAVLVERHA